MQKKTLGLLFSFSLTLSLFFAYFSCKKKAEPATINFSQTVVTAILRPGQMIGKLSFMFKGSALPTTDVRYVLTPNVENNNLLEIKNNGEIYLKQNGSLQDLSILSFQVVAKYNKNYENVEETKTFHLPVRPAFLEFRMINQLVKGSASGTLVGYFSITGEGLDAAKMNNMNFKIVPNDDRFLIQKYSELVLRNKLTDDSDITLTVTAENSNYLFNSNSSLENRKVILSVSDFGLEFIQDHLDISMLSNAITGLSLGRLNLLEEIESSATANYRLVADNNCKYANSTYIAIGSQDGAVRLTNQGANYFRDNGIRETCFTVEATKNQKSVRMTGIIRFYWVQFTSRMYKTGLECTEGKNYAKKFYTHNEELGALTVYLGDQKIETENIQNIKVIRNNDLTSDPLYEFLTIESFRLKANLKNSQDILEFPQGSKIKLQIDFNDDNFTSFQQELDLLLIEIQTSDTKIYNKGGGTGQFIDLKVYREKTPNPLTKLILSNSSFEAINNANNVFRFRPKTVITKNTVYPFQVQMNADKVCIDFMQNVTINPIIVDISCDFEKEELEFIPEDERYTILKPSLYLGSISWRENASVVNFVSNSNTLALTVANTQKDIVNILPTTGNQYSGIVRTGNDFNKIAGPIYILNFSVKKEPYYNFTTTCELPNIKQAEVSVTQKDVFHGEEGILFNAVFKSGTNTLTPVQTISLSKPINPLPNSSLITANNLIDMNATNQAKGSDYWTKNNKNYGYSAFTNIFFNSTNTSTEQQVELTAENDLYSTKVMRTIRVNRMGVRLLTNSSYSCPSGNTNIICQSKFTSNTNNITIGTYQVNLSASSSNWQTATVLDCSGSGNNVNVNTNGTINVQNANMLGTFTLQCDFEYGGLNGQNKHHFKEKITITVQ